MSQTSLLPFSARGAASAGADFGASAADANILKTLNH